MRFSCAGLLISVPLVLAMGAVVVSSTAREAWAQATNSVFSAENAPVKKPGTVKKLPKPRAPGTQPPSASPSIDSSSAPSSGPAPSLTMSGGFYGSRAR